MTLNMVEIDDYRARMKSFEMFLNLNKDLSLNLAFAQLLANKAANIRGVKKCVPFVVFLTNDRA